MEVVMELKQKTFIRIVAKSDSASLPEKHWDFVRSSSGQLDFAEDEPSKSKSAADASAKKPDMVLDASPFFSCGWYTWLPENVYSNITIEITGSTKIADADLFAYLTHIGALLCAVDARDALLAAEIFNRRSSIFMKYYPLTQMIIEPIAVEGLFSWVWGGFMDDGVARLQCAMKGQVGPKEVWDVVEAFYTAAQDKFYPQAEEKLNPAAETAEEMMIRYFKTHENIKITLGLVGTNFNPWVSDNLDYVTAKLRKQEMKDLIAGTELAKNARKRIFEQTAASIQAEPYNPHDSNAIAVYLDDIQAKASGRYGLQRAGYIRRTGASIIRFARPDKLKFESKLARIGNCSGDDSVVVQMII